MIQIADLLGRSLRGTSDEDLSLRISRCLTDQAYAHIFDIGVASFEEKRKRLLSAIDLYHQALAMTTWFDHFLNYSLILLYIHMHCDENYMVIKTHHNVIILYTIALSILILTA